MSRPDSPTLVAGVHCMLTIVDIIVEANPTSLDVLKTRIAALEQSENPPTQNVPRFVRLKKIEHLHFMSIQIFEDQHFDPLLVFENNYDGGTGQYWKSVENCIGNDLREIFACTKPAIDPRWAPLFASGSQLSLMPFLKEYSLSPSASHIGATGMTVDRIKREHILCDDIELYLNTQAKQLRALRADTVHQQLRQWALAKPPYVWLNTPEPRRTMSEWVADWILLLLHVLPALAMIVLLILMVFTNELPPKCHPVLAAVVGVFFALLVAFLVVVRRVEKSDMTQENPQLSQEQLAMFAQLEDQIVQNHLGSMVLVKPGVVRSIAIRGALGLLKRLVPITGADGYLSSMRTIHFAHWTLVGNGGRLLFLSNFDGSWQSYLDDFVDKAHTGLTFAWGNCVGFPRTKWLLCEGATHGHDFKAWARQSQTITRLWYSAYSDLTVNQIVRNTGVADGLRKSTMTETEAAEWAKLL